MRKTNNIANLCIIKLNLYPQYELKNNEGFVKNQGSIQHLGKYSTLGKLLRQITKTFATINWTIFKFWGSGDLGLNVVKCSPWHSGGLH